MPEISHVDPAATVSALEKVSAGMIEEVSGGIAAASRDPPPEGLIWIVTDQGEEPAVNFSIAASSSHVVRLP
jgi:hypothetical protein